MAKLIAVSRAMVRVLGVAVGVVGVMEGASVCLGQVALVSDFRTASLSANGVVVQELPASAFAPFRVSPSRSGGVTAVAAMQDSVASPSLFDASVAVTGSIAYPGVGVPPCSTAVASSDFNVDFSVAQFVDFTFEVRLRNTSSRANLTAAFFDLSRGPGEVIYELVDAPNDAAETTQTYIGTLQPGVYTIRMTAGGSAGVCDPAAASFDLLAELMASFAVNTCPADFSRDGFVDDTDFVTFAAAYEGFTCPTNVPSCAGDISGDGFVDDTDFVFFAAAYEGFVCP